MNFHAVLEDFINYTKIHHLSQIAPNKNNNINGILKVKNASRKYEFVASVYNMTKSDR